MNRSTYRFLKSKYLAIACILAGFAFFSSCSPNSGIGNNVLPPGTINAKFVDTTTVVTSLVLEDTVPTFNTEPYYMLGTYTDPIFGPTKASFYTQFYLPGNGTNPFLPTGDITTSTLKVVLDSVVLQIPYGSGPDGYFYGTQSSQNIQVYALNPKTHFKADSSYYSDATLPHSTLLGERTVNPQFNQYYTVYYPADSLVALNNTGDTKHFSQFVSSPCLTVKLNHAWGQSWLDTALSGFPNLVPASQNDTMVQNSAPFQRNFPGVYVTVSNSMQYPGQGGVWCLNPYANLSGIIFYCRIINPNPANGKTYSRYFTANFGINTGCVAFPHFDHDYTGCTFYAPHGKNDSVNSPNLIYVQGLGGMKTKIDFPYIMNWVKKNKVIVNRAEVDIPVDQNAFSIYSPPEKLFLIGINDTSTVPSTATFSLPDENSPLYGGEYDATNHRYVFDIALYIQNVLDKKTIDHGLYLVAGSSAIAANRVVAYGGKGNSPAQRTRLRLYYTPLKQ